jgi:uncharacterized protein (DUF2164 family)
MTFELEKHESDVAICSLKQYFATELDMALNDLQARLLLDYILREFGPLAYNRGVQDAERFMRARVEDLPGACFEQPLAATWCG